MCFLDDGVDADLFKSLKHVEGLLDAGYRYWEILVAAEESGAIVAEALIGKLKNLRFITLRPNLTTYRARALTAAEAIGDVVVLTTANEAQRVDLNEMIAAASKEQRIIVVNRDAASIGDQAVRLLGSAGGFLVSTRLIQTMAFPRTLLSTLLKHPDREIALRFPPRDAALPVTGMTVQSDRRQLSLSIIARRFGLLQKLSVAIAPRVLSSVSMLSIVVFTVALVFALYAVLVWLFLDDVQPGWLTTSLAISFTAAFLGYAVFGLSAGIQKVIDIVSPQRDDGIVEEHSDVDLFSEVMKELNIQSDPSGRAERNTDVDVK